jgi:hypothetical protein
MTMSEFDKVCEQIKNLRKSISNGFATRSRGNMGWMLSELDRLVDRKKHLESGRTIPEAEFAKQRG